MEIKQGSNSPIKLEFDVPVTAIKLSAALHNEKKVFKNWLIEDLENESVVFLPLTETETFEFSPGRCNLEVKILDEGENIIFYDEVGVTIIKKHDKTKLT